MIAGVEHHFRRNTVVVGEEMIIQPARFQLRRQRPDGFRRQAGEFMEGRLGEDEPGAARVQLVAQGCQIADALLGQAQTPVIGLAGAAQRAAGIAPPRLRHIDIAEIVNFIQPIAGIGPLEFCAREELGGRRQEARDGEDAQILDLLAQREKAEQTHSALKIGVDRVFGQDVAVVFLVGERGEYQFVRIDRLVLQTVSLV